MILSSSQVREYLSQAGFKGTALQAALDIAYCESGFNTNAHNTNGEDSRGLMQINVSPNANPQYYNFNLFDPRINTQVAYQIFKAWGNKFAAWTCSTNPNYVHNELQQIPIITIAFVGLALYLIS